MTKVSGSVLKGLIIQSRRRGRAPAVQSVFVQVGKFERLFGLVEKVFLPTEVADRITGSLRIHIR